MKIEKNCVVQFHYTVTESGHGPLESSTDTQPMTVLMGHGQLLAGVEAAMLGKGVGEEVAVDLPPEQAYGHYQPGRTQRIAKKHFDNTPLAPGMQVVLHTEQGQRAVTVLKLGLTVVDVDLNHPMAGKTLHFAIQILDVRAATKEELAHGHAHPQAAQPSPN